MKFTIAIPCYEMHGVGVKMLGRCLNSVSNQSFRDFEIVVTDDSDDNKLADLCDNFVVRYVRNLGAKGMAGNTNYGIKQSQGELIKILYQDDFFAHKDALQVIAENFKDEDNWLITACSNNPKPFYSPDRNTLGSPSVLTMRNEGHLLFDESLSWVLDLDLYKRLYARYGIPRILEDVNVVMGIGSHQHTNHLSLEDKLKEELINAER